MYVLTSGRKTTLEPPEQPCPAQQWLLKHPHECHPRDMNREKSIGILASVLACCVSVTAQDRGLWRAANSSAQSITGDVAISGDKLSINYTSFTIAQIRALAPAEVGAAFDMDSSSVSKGYLYRLNVPGTKRFNAQEHSVSDQRIRSGWPPTPPGTICILHFSQDRKCPSLRPRRSLTQPIYAAPFLTRAEQAAKTRTCGTAEAVPLFRVVSQWAESAVERSAVSFRSSLALFSSGAFSLPGK